MYPSPSIHFATIFECVTSTPAYPSRHIRSKIANVLAAGCWLQVTYRNVALRQTADFHRASLAPDGTLVRAHIRPPIRQESAKKHRDQQRHDIRSRNGGLRICNTRLVSLQNCFVVIIPLLQPPRRIEEARRIAAQRRIQNLHVRDEVPQLLTALLDAEAVFG